MYKMFAITLTLAASSAIAADIGNVPANPVAIPQTKMTAQNAVPSIAPQAAADIVEKQHALIVDVRELSEVAATRIPGAINIPLSQFSNRLAELDSYKNSPIITQCRSGRRSAEALKILAASGFTNVQNLEGGIMAWEKAGLKTEKQ
ncbi:MAG: rhodanese-like domain-containing protein [Methyloglobulus sp.]|nr:rhodanese-like domain-containing protein [Methyloglobulus sp.]